MKIGILTLPLHTNYGGILQVYALQTILERLGNEVWIIDSPRIYTLPLYKKPLAYSKRIIQKYLFHKNIVINQEKKNQQEKIVLQTNTRKFVNMYLHIKSYNNLEDIQEKDFDAFVVGSDQIWRPKYVKRLITDKVENVFLGFTKGWKVKRIAYAASFGTDNWEYNIYQTKKCQRRLKLFDSVSVRELSGVDLCRKKFNIQAQVVLDPTLLLSKNDYINLIQSSNDKIDGELMTYILDENTAFQNLIDNIVKKTGWKPFSSNKKTNDKSIMLQERIQPPVENWLIGFRNAQFVITDSFHACVFSIIFNKPFLVIGNAERGMSRFYSLLRMFGLEHRMVQNPMDFVLEDWCFVHPNVDVDKFQKASITFLEKSLMV